MMTMSDTSASSPSTCFSPTRGAVVLVVVGCMLAGLVCRVAYLQTYGRQETILRAERQHHQTERLPARRGSIFDSHGTLIACTIQNRGVFVDPKFMHERYQEENRWLQMDKDVATLADLLEYDRLTLAKLIADRSEDRYICLHENIDEPTYQAIRELKMPGVGFMPVNQRVYPMGSFAAHIIGGVGAEQKGLEGVELKFNDLLDGTDGSQRTLKDARRRAIGVSDRDYVEPRHGEQLVLTIDANIQTIAEEELAAACARVKAPRGEVIVMDPYSGDVLALANYPTFDPQLISESLPEVRTNNALVAPYEPGSALKPFLVGPAIGEGLTRPGEVWPIQGISWNAGYAGRQITDVHGYGPLTTWDILVKSSNIGTAMIARRMENARIHAGLTRFGFGQKTGIELAGEDPGLLPALSRWKKWESTDSVAQGYAMMVTPVQLARAFCAFANGGRLPEVHLVKGFVGSDGRIVSRNPRLAYEQLPQVVSPQAAAEIRRILADVPVRGTATIIKSKTPEGEEMVPGWHVWNIFGKTGTAHISMGRAGYSPTKFNSTFLAGAPYERPRLVVAMTLHEADRSIAHYGGAVSGPPAARILVRSLAYLQVEPSSELPAPPADVARRLVNYQPSVYHKPKSQSQTRSD